jgi:hypothetical protein
LMENLEEFKKLIYFKYVFFVGSDQETMANALIFQFLQALLSQNMKPFAVYMIRNVTS